MLQKLVFDYTGERGIAHRFRMKRAEAIRRVILALKREDGTPVRVLDLGGRETYWKTVGLDWLRETGVRITLLNVSAEESEISEDNTDLFEGVAGDGCALDYPDGEFDLCFSNSVIEHVGDFERMHRFANETKRVARAYYCQTPNFWFPIEPHFLFLGFHYLPEPTRVFLLRRFDLGHYKKVPDIIGAWKLMQSARLIDANAFAALFDDAKIVKERFLGVFTKSLIAVKEPQPESSTARALPDGGAEETGTARA